MSLLVTSGRHNAEHCPNDDGLCCFCIKKLEETRALVENLAINRESPAPRRSWNAPARSRNSLNVTRPTPRPLRPAPPRNFSGGSGSQPSASSIRPKLYPQLSSVVPMRSGSESLLTNRLVPTVTANTNSPYYTSASDKAKMPIPYQAPFEASSSTTPYTVPVNRPYPHGQGEVFQYITGPFLTLGLGPSGPSSGNIVYPNHSIYAGGIPDPRLGMSQLPVSIRPTSGSSFVPYKNHQQELRESEGLNGQPVLAPNDKKRALTEDFELRTVVNPAKRRELAEQEKHQKKVVKELLLFKEFAALEISNGVDDDLDLSLHL